MATDWDRHMKDSLDHWLTTPPDEYEAPEEANYQEAPTIKEWYESASAIFLAVADEQIGPDIESVSFFKSPIGTGEWMAWLKRAFRAGFESGVSAVYNASE